MADLEVTVIVPSSYSDTKKKLLYQYRWVLMMPPVLFVLKALVQLAAKALGANVLVRCVEERLQVGDIYLDKICERQITDQKQLVFLSVKSFELSRGIDIARRLKRWDVEVVMGGPGITMADWKTYQYLYGQGICFNVGEGEETVSRIIADALTGCLKPWYWQRTFVDLESAPMPVPYNPDDHRGSAPWTYVGVDTSQGCPFDCGYCGETVLRGRKVRARKVESVIGWIADACDRGCFSFMLTDDNVRRSPKFGELAEALIKLNKRVGKRLQLLVQLDAACDIFSTIPLLAKMGVVRVFLGLESLDPVALKSANKNHNNVALYREIVDKFHEHGIFVDTGWMVGFSNQTPEGILQEAEKLSGLVDFAYPFIVTPLPGTKDYRTAVSEGTLTTFDPNILTTRHAVRNWFDKSSMAEIQQAYHEAFPRFFSLSKLLRGAGRREIETKRFYLHMAARFLAEVGNVLRGNPLHFMMEGWPRHSGVVRPEDSFRGFALTAEDVEPGRKEAFLASHIL